MAEEGVKKPKEEQKVNFIFKDASKHGKRILQADEIKKQFGERVLFQGSSFCIQRGEKVGLLGPNDCGKTTLIKLILGDAQLDEGKIWISPSAKIGCLSQDISDLNIDQTVLEILGLEAYTFIDFARCILANMGLDETMIYKKIKQLSMGERIRVKLANLILNKSVLLILDEPSNHLDLFSREELEEALLTYEGTMFIVSHDRYMLEKLCNRFLVFNDEQIRKFEGNFYEYEQKKTKEKGNSLEKVKEELMILQNRMTVVLSKFNDFSAEDPEYQELDVQFKEMVKRKRDLQDKMKK
ncbi:MAG: ABC-F family ATP-binding cassette domain-containing protein [Halanaerobiales bacterium]|nr:ABC-F family ATP-binding cassette domain-containing protein [Halanaerobiales bacterium]